MKEGRREISYQITSINAVPNNAWQLLKKVLLKGKHYCTLLSFKMVNISNSQKNYFR